MHCPGRDACLVNEAEVRLHQRLDAALPTASVLILALVGELARRVGVIAAPAATGPRATRAGPAFR